MPTRDTPWPNGTPCWIDYGASDVGAARDFYGSLFGWEFTGGDPEYGGYFLATRNDEHAAGLSPLMNPADSPGWTTYFAADDAQATADRIREAGGAIVVEPMDVAPMGTMVIACDPQGNGFGLWQAAQNTGVRVYNEPGALVWNEAAADDPASAREFYAAVFGFSFDDVPGAEDYATFATAGNPLGGLSRLRPGSPKGWTVCFGVESVDDAVGQVEAAGGKVTMAPQDTEFGRFAVLEDPWGAPFSVMETPAGS
jgi:predicted enzyme related to lactoylglutathione lyase